MNQVVPATLNPPLFNAQGDQIDYTYYDRLALHNASGAIEREWFVNGIGQDDPVTGVRKTIADTNVRGGAIPEGQAFNMFALKFWYEAQAVMTEAERISWNQWVHGATIEFLIESKNQYGTWKLSEIMGAVDDSQVTASATGQAFSPSRGVFNGIKPFNLIIPLPRLTSYSVRLTQGVASIAGLDEDFLCCGMVGVLNRKG